MRFSKRKIAIIIGIPLSILFLYLAFRKVEFSKAVEILKTTNYVYLIPALLAFLCDFTLRAVRWNFLLMPIKKCRFINSLSTVFIGFFANNVLPMRAGEIIRAVMLGEKEKISKTSVVATLVVERILDMFALIILLMIAFFIFPFPDYIKKIWLIGLVILSIVLLLMYGLIFFQAFTLRIMDKFLHIFPKRLGDRIENMLKLFIQGLEIMKKSHYFFISFLLSIAIWLADAAVFFFVAKGMEIHQVGYMGAAFVMCVIALGISVPSSPGFIGVYEYFGILGCSVLGVDKSVALSFMLLTHVMQILAMSVMGTTFLAREHLSLIQLEREAEKES
ncbi:MAG: flippase-like domain-containing protein [Elusimicrobia bacterium]|nr:flippase-like domain-containing protein [Elusimicrobiota bacterium]